MSGAILGGTLQEGISDDKSDPMRHSISNFNLTKQELEQLEEKAQVLKQLELEKLPGVVKSKWALNHKLKMEKAIEDALNHKVEVIDKVKTKGRFPIKAPTNAGNWLKDR